MGSIPVKWSGQGSPVRSIPRGMCLYGPAGGFWARGMSRHAVRLICAGWLPHDRCSSGAFRLSKIERHRHLLKALQCNNSGYS